MTRLEIRWKCTHLGVPMANPEAVKKRSHILDVANMKLKLMWRNSGLCSASGKKRPVEETDYPSSRARCSRNRDVSARISGLRCLVCVPHGPKKGIPYMRHILTTASQR